MNRRSNDANGWVNFPINDSAYRNTKEGGMVVKLVVTDDNEFDEQYGICSGAWVTDTLSESLIADDQRPRPVYNGEYNSIEDVQKEQQELAEWEEYHFPFVNDKDDPGYTSRPYLASMVLGTTGWSGWHEEHGALWRCTYDDLTVTGKGLYTMLKKLYECDGVKRRIHLLTFLDT